MNPADLQTLQRAAWRPGHLPIFELDGLDTLLLSNTTLSTFKQCWTRGSWRSRWRREPVASQAPLVAGSALHAALAVRYMAVGSGEVDLETEAQMLDTVSKHFSEAGFEPASDEWRTPERIQQVVRDYNLQYPVESFTVLAVERMASRELGIVKVGGRNIRIIWVTISDLDIRTADGQLVVVDHKTTTQFGPTFQNKFRNHAGTLGYLWDAAQQYNELCLEFWINAIVIREPPKTKSKYPPQEFHRLRFPVTQSRTNEWRENTLRWASLLLQREAAQNFPMNEEACTAYYGTCPYLDVCTLVPEQRLVALGTDMFRDVEWVSLEKME